MTYSSLSGFFRGKRVLVTGHTGFKGSWLSYILIGMGAEVSGYSLAPDTEPNMYSAMRLDNDMKSEIADVRDYGRLLKAFEKGKPEIVLHLAAQPLVRASYDDPLYTFSTNVMGTANVLECIRKTGTVKSSVIITTDKVYEPKSGARGDAEPHKETDALGGYDPYSSSKVCAEHVTRSYIRSYFNPETSKPSALIASARAGNVIGGGDWSKDRIVPDIMRSLFEKKTGIVLRSPSAIRPWQHVLDPLFGYLLLSKRLYEGDAGKSGAWNFAPDAANFVTVEELTKRTLARAGRGSYSVKPDDSKHETAILKLDASKARAGLGWKPLLGIGECVEWTADWYKDFYSGTDARKATDRQIIEFGKCVDYG